ncbi:MAG: ester cyclase [Tildeniella torsiva UHER 1998/13D]|jgi:predicted ester cyclase|nr:ester cyclase [Tildeniella torsiva UHER 1998/13D]
MIFTSRRWFAVVFGAALALTPMAALTCPEQAALTAEEQLALAAANNQVALDLFEPAWNEGDLSVVDRLIVPNALDHSPLATEEGSEGFKRIIGAFRAAMPDTRMTVEDEIYMGDRVVHRWRVEGTHTAAPLFGVEPSGKTIVLTGITIVRVEDGLIQERWTQLDQLGLMQQLGLAPSPGGN